MAVLQWLWRRKATLCRCCCISFVVMVITLILAGYSLINSKNCSNDESQQLIADLCSLYRKKEVAGSLCHALCQEKTIQFDQCTNYIHGKKVLFMSCVNCEPTGTVQTVMKMKRELGKRDELKVMDNKDGDFTEDSWTIIRDIFLHTVQTDVGLNISSHKHLLSYLWGYNFDSFIHENGRKASSSAVQSIWSLIQQTEYLLLRTHQAYPFIPKIYGTCGPAYFMEFAPPGEELSAFKIAWSWPARARLALDILDVLQTLDTRLNQRLHLCDVKGENFGLNASNQVMLIDVDCALMESILVRNYENSRCSKDEDCDFFDCKSACNTVTGQCGTQRQNNNLQSVCQKVFRDKIPHMNYGLLRSPPASVRIQLMTVLDECAYPGKNGNPRAKAPPEIEVRLRQILQRSLV